MSPSRFGPCLEGLATTFLHYSSYKEHDSGWEACRRAWGFVQPGEMQHWPSEWNKLFLGVLTNLL